MERLIVFALVFLLPTQLTYRVWPDFSYIYGLRVDYLSITLYLTDILIFLLIPYFIKRLKKQIKERHILRQPNKTMAVLFASLLFFVLNIIFAEVPFTALIKWINILKFVFLGTYFYLSDLEKMKRTVSSALKYSIITYTLIGLLQFIFQKTIGGPLYFLGERSFLSTTPGISLMYIFDKVFMRAYSTFPHPNSFAGFIPVALLIYLFLTKDKNKNRNKNKAVFLLFLFVVLSQIITFSLNALVGMIFVLFVFYFSNKYSKENSSIKGNLLNNTKKYLPVVLIIASLLFAFFSPRLLKNLSYVGNSSESVAERIVLAKRGLEVFSKKTIIGVGLNNFFKVSKSTQPIHNVYLIVLCECGLLGIVIVYWLITKLMKQNINIYLLSAIMFILITGLFDHYWFTIQQNQLIFSILLGLSLRKG